MALKICLVFCIVVGHSILAQECQFYNSEKSYVCNNITDSFPSIFYGSYRLECVECTIETFSENTFPFDNKLTSFNASTSGIARIKSKAFSSLSNVQYVYLSDNRINYIAENAFSGLKQLFELHLENNNLKTLVPGFLNDFQSNLVNLSDNLLSVIPNEAFKGSESILILDLSSNEINNIETKAFAGLNDLEELDLRLNKLCHLKLGTFETLKYLRRLNLADNKFTRFALGSFSGLTNLNYLVLANNSLEMLDGGVLLPFMHLIKLDVSGNGMHIFDAHDVYVNVPTIKFVSIEDNVLSCTLLKNVLQYFKGKGIEVENNVNRYDYHNVNGIACIDDYVITERVALSYFLKKAKEAAGLLVSYC